ncbi:MAG TPA: hypothetical protein VLC53_13085 [Myxococcota bacterium]|nr:hypothetical protein [Myxococcota bacterium]
MIDPLRRRHRVFSAALAALVPPAFAVALAARPPEAPLSDSIPPLLAASPAVGVERWASDELWSPLGIRTRLFEPAARGGPVVELAPARDLRRPSLLVYWAPSGAPGALPPRAHLVGRLAGAEARRFTLPPTARLRPGRLYLYSLGHYELLGSAALDPATRPPAPAP